MTEQPARPENKIQKTRTARQQKSMAQLSQESWLSGGSETWLETLYESWCEDPASVPPAWQAHFQQLAGDAADVSHTAVQAYFREQQKTRPLVRKTTAVHADIDAHRILQQEKLVDLVTAYRSFGHLLANLDPLGLSQGTRHPALELDWYGFSAADGDTLFDTRSFAFVGQPQATLNQVVDALQKTWCGTLGVEYMHISTQAEVDWIQQRMEQEWPGAVLSAEEKLHLLDRLVAADGLEKHIGLKYVGQKRFSLEGGDSLIPLLDTLVRRGAAQGLREIVIGMAHRGRLNVLVNILGKAPAGIFEGFEGKYVEDNRSGDVKYHLGYSSDLATPSGPVHVALAFNPSHLEIISPVVQGSVRSRQRRRKDTLHERVMPVQLHGDAAFAGQGVVMETFGLSQTRWFMVGGSIHVVVNNQIGFTISDIRDARSSRYCTDIAKMVEAPVLHVNANDPEAVCFAANLAVDYRTHFKKDIVIDLVCYRRHGHNEADEPSATQPCMYQAIRALSPVCKLYADSLVESGLVAADALQSMTDAYRARLDRGEPVVELAPHIQGQEYEFANAWQPFEGTEWTAPGETAVPTETLQLLGVQLAKLPAGFQLQPQVKKMLEMRNRMLEGAVPLNWGCAEMLAFASLLLEGCPIRLCGQDACRGTFAHRHAILHDQETDAIYIPLSHVSEKQAQVNLVDSLLSEEAVLAFEYGYAAAEPRYLVIWEAQFGDFANGAQVVIDQFVSSGEQKWGRLCGLVINLPHGYEGQGPEHSSARLERYLQLCAQQNMQVCVPSTPAQVFHMLRRQILRPWRKPLIVMTPKSLLRHPAAVSSLSELSAGGFQTVLQETGDISADQVARVILCSGKIYYELAEMRQKNSQKNVAILRIEQLYPFDTQALQLALRPYAAVREIVWCQEEPMNQGAWTFMRDQLSCLLSRDQVLGFAGRGPAASPATGHLPVHQQEQEALVRQALSGQPVISQHV